MDNHEIKSSELLVSEDAKRCDSRGIKQVVHSFFTEEDGMGVLEIVVIIAVLLSLALLFRKQAMAFAGELMEKIFDTNKEGYNVEE